MGEILSADGDNAPGRPSLKRRTPSAEDGADSTGGQGSGSSEARPDGPPRLKRNTTTEGGEQQKAPAADQTNGADQP